MLLIVDVIQSSRTTHVWNIMLITLAHSLLSSRSYFWMSVCRIGSHNVCMAFTTMVVIEHENVTLAGWRIKICHLINWIVKSSITSVNDVVRSNVLLHNLSFISVMAVVISCIWLFLWQIISMVLWCWTQELLWRVVSYDHILLTCSVAIVSSS